MCLHKNIQFQNKKIQLKIINKKVLLDLSSDGFNFDKEISPFIRQGIIIDACVIKTLIDGFIETRISKKNSANIPDFEMILRFLELIKIKNEWNRFFVTPHILTEVFQLFRDMGYHKWENYQDVLKEIMPLINSMGEVKADKIKILKHINHKNPVIQMGDISIYVTVDDLTDSKNKIAVLSADLEVINRFINDPRVLAMNYRQIMLNFN